MDFLGETREGLLVLKGNICVDDDNERMPSQHNKGSIFKHCSKHSKVTLVTTKNDH